MPGAGLEPARPKTQDFKSCVSTNSTTRAIIEYFSTWILLLLYRTLSVLDLLSSKFWINSLITGIKSAYTIIKLMVPVVILVRVLEALGVTAYLSAGMGPVVELLGLPAWTSIVWATAILSNLYAGLALLISSEGFSSLTAAQMSVLGTGMLIAHSLPVEARITQALGVKFWHMIAIRLLSAFVLCFILNLIYSYGGLLTEPIVLSWEPPVSSSQDSSYFALLLAEITSLASLSLIVVVMVVVVEVFKVIKVVHYCELLLQPLLRFMGVSSGLAHIMAVGGLLGLTYGSGLLIAESKKGRFDKRELAVALVFISMCHALLEDSMIMLLTGAHLSAVLFARFIFCLVVASVLMRWSYARKLKFYK